jgi:urea-proton symporter
LFFSQHIYDVAGLTGWVAVGIAWTFLSAFSVVIYPLWESRRALLQITSGIYKVRFQRLCCLFVNSLSIAQDLFTKGSGKHVKALSPTSAA